jgi:hypothetical protein
MGSFQLIGLSPQQFEPLFALSDADLRAMNVRRVHADADFGFPCRISLEDAQPGDELLLLAFQHQAAASPYQASGPIYVRRGALQRRLQPGKVPPYVSQRQISLRAYNGEDLIIAAEVVEGPEVSTHLRAMFADPSVKYVHLHNAKRGCFSCTALPASEGEA